MISMGIPRNPNESQSPAHLSSQVRKPVTHRSALVFQALLEIFKIISTDGEHARINLRLTV